MSSSHRWSHLALAGAVLLSTACIRTRTDPITGKIDVDVESPTKRGEDWKAGIAGLSGYGGVTGQARAAVLKGESSITVSLNGLTPGATHGWRVNEGKCGMVGALAGTDAAYPAFTASDRGTGESVARLSTALDEAKKYHVRIFATATDTNTVVACGDLSDSA